MGNRKKIFYSATIFLAFLISSFSNAQVSAPLEPIICYGTGKSEKSSLPYPASKLKTRKLSTFEITFEGVPQEAINAFNYAVAIWESSIESSVPIKVKATWKSLESNALASTGATTIYRDFDEKAIENVWYPVPLAEKIAGKNLNGSSSSDINITINSNEEWYFGTDGNTPETRIDFVSVILHELAHGLGIISSADVEERNGTLRESDHLLIYDYFLENKNRFRLSSHNSPSRELFSEFTSNDLYIHTPSAASANNNKYPKIFAPKIFDSGSSISHLDEDEFSVGNPNSLMSPRFARAEAIHQPGAVLLGILSDLGWTEQTFLVYPNPSSGIFTLKFSNDVGDLTVKVTDAMGKEILQVEGDFFYKTMELDLSHFPIGFYHLIVSSSMLNSKKSLVIAR